MPLFEEDGLRMGEIARRARLSKQTMTTMVRLLERDGLVERRSDPADGRAARIFLTARAHAFRPVAETVLAEIDAVAVATLTQAEARGVRTGLHKLMDLAVGHESLAVRRPPAAT